MLTSNTLNNAIDLNKQMYLMMQEKNAVNKNYLSTYSDTKTDEVQFYQDIDKKKKRNRLKKGLALGFSAITTLSIIGIALFRNKKVDLKNAQNFFQTNQAKASNCMLNLLSFKDDLWDRAATKTKGTKLQWIKTGGDKLSNIYRSWANGKYRNKFNNSLQELQKLNKDGAIKDLPEDFDSWSKVFDTAIDKELHKENNRVTNQLINKEFLKNGKENTKEFLHKITSKNIGDSKIENLNEVINAKKSIEIPKDASKELKEAIEKFNTIKLKTAEDLIPKYKEISLGNAATDFITILASLGMFGGSVALADNKEERKSMILNLGIPLLSTIGFAIFGTARCISGTASLLMGFACGQIAKIGAKAIDKATTDIKKDIENTFVA